MYYFDGVSCSSVEFFLSLKNKKNYKNFRLLTGHSHREVHRQEAAVTKQPSPQLYPDNSKDEEDKEAEQQHIAQHRESVQQKSHQDSHTCTTRRVFAPILVCKNKNIKADKRTTSPEHMPCKSSINAQRSVF